MSTCKIVIDVFLSEARSLYGIPVTANASLHIAVNLLRPLLDERVQTKRHKMRILKAGTYGKLPRENWSKARNPLQLFRDMAPALTLNSQTGNTDESRKCSHENANECAPPPSLDPQKTRHAHTENFVSNSITHITPSIYPSTVLLCQASLICLSSSKCLSGGRFGRKDEERLRMLVLFSVFQEGSYPGLVSIVWAFMEQKKNGGVHDFCSPLSSGNRSSTCLFNLADTQASSTHTSTMMTSSARPFSTIQPSKST